MFRIREYIPNVNVCRNGLGGFINRSTSFNRFCLFPEICFLNREYGARALKVKEEIQLRAVDRLGRPWEPIREGEE